MRKAVCSLCAASPVYRRLHARATVERDLAAVRRAQQRLCLVPLPLHGTRLHCSAAATAVTGHAAGGTNAGTNAAATATLAAANADAATGADAAITNAAPTVTVAGRSTEQEMDVTSRLRAEPPHRRQQPRALLRRGARPCRLRH
jgi:hypothetical protein